MHVSAYILEGIQFILDAMGFSNGIAKFTINFLGTVFYQGAVFYAQVTYLYSDFDKLINKEDDSSSAAADKEVPAHWEYDRNQRAKYWLLLEITYYYATLILTSIFLFTHSIFKLKIPAYPEN